MIPGYQTSWERRESVEQACVTRKCINLSYLCATLQCVPLQAIICTSETGPLWDTTLQAELAFSMPYRFPPEDTRDNKMMASDKGARRWMEPGPSHTYVKVSFPDMNISLHMTNFHASVIIFLGLFVIESIPDQAVDTSVVNYS